MSGEFDPRGSFPLDAVEQAVGSEPVEWNLVESGGYRGLVTDIRMRVTYLRGARGEMIVVPNGELFNRTLVISAAPPDWASGPEAILAEHDSKIPESP